MKRRTMLTHVGAMVALGVLPCGIVQRAFAAAEGHTPLVDATWLHENLGRGDLVIVDIRGADVAEAFALGHVPGSVWAPYPTGWMGTPEIPGSVPAPEALQAQIAGLGINQDSHVVIIDDSTSVAEFGAAARVYWTLKYVGHDKVSILDGGWSAWTAETATPMIAGLSTPKPGNFRPLINAAILTTTDQVAASLGTSTLLIDARSTASYVGAKKSLAATRAGHIPGAINNDGELLWDTARNRLKPVEELAQVLPASLSSKTASVVSYCDAGHGSAAQWFVLHELLGYSNASLYADSMIGWSLDPSREVEQ